MTTISPFKIAVHEAGHVVAMLYYGIEIEEAVATPNKGFVLPKDPDYSTEKTITTLAAGLAATNFYYEENWPPPGADNEASLDFWCAKRVAHYLIFTRSFTESFVQAMLNETEVFDRNWAFATTLLRPLMPLVTQIAEALTAFEVLHEREIDLLLKHHFAYPSEKTVLVSEWSSLLQDNRSKPSTARSLPRWVLARQFKDIPSVEEVQVVSAY